MTNSNISLSKIFIEFNLPMPVLHNNIAFNVNNGYQNFNNNYNFGFGNNYNNFNNNNGYYPYNNKNGNFNKSNYSTQQNFYPKNNYYQNQQDPKKPGNDNAENAYNNNEKTLNDNASSSTNDNESVKSKLKEISIYDEPKSANNNNPNFNKNDEKLGNNHNYKVNRIQEKNNFITLSNPENQNNYFYNNNNKKNKYSNGNDFYANNGFQSTKNPYQRNGGSFNEKRQFDNNTNYNKFKNYNNANDSNNQLNDSVKISDNSKKFSYDNSNLSNVYNLNLSKANSNPTFDYNNAFNHNQTFTGINKGFEEKIYSIGKTNMMTNSQLKSFGTNNAAANGNYSKLTGGQILLTLYEGMCNFLIFAKACTPYVNKSVSHLLDDTRVNDYFKSFEKISAYGLDVNFINEQSKNNLILKYLFKF